MNRATLFRLVLAAGILWAFSLACAHAGREGGKGMIVGGACEYDRYMGRAEIVSITPLEEPKAGDVPGYRRYDVQFKFSADEPLPESQGQILHRSHRLTLINGWHPGPRFIQKYGIEVGKVFDCFLNVIKKGTCTPVLFEFPTIDRGDYFEHRP